MGTTLALVLAALAAEPSGARVGVFQLGIVGADPALQQTAIDAIATALSEAGIAVVSRSDLDALLGAEKLRDAVGCNDVACMAEVGAAAGVERIVSGSLSKMDNGWLVSLQLVNTKFATVENRVTLEWPDPKLDLPNGLGAAAELVAIPAAERGPGSVRITGAPSDAALMVDGTTKGVGLPEITDIGVGVHVLRIDAPGFEPYSAPFAVRRGRPTRLDAALVALPAFYTRWWFWTATAAVVAGGATAAVLLTRDGGPLGGADHASGKFEVPAISALSWGSTP